MANSTSFSWDNDGSRDMALTVSRTQARKIAGTRSLFSSRENNSHNTPRPKRHLDRSEGDSDDVVAKKPKLAPGIATLHALLAKDTADTVDNAGTSDISKAKSAPTPPKPPAIAALKAPASHRAPRAKANRPKPATTKQQQRPRSTPTAPRSKVVKGLMNELVSLKPNEADTVVQGRKLRSQETVRYKSELSSYFPEYDEIIGNDPKETHILNIDTPIVIIPEPSSQPNTDNTSPHAISPHPQPRNDYPTRSYGDALYTDLCDARRVNFSFLTNSMPTSDPLPDALFVPAHKKAERTERSIRKTEMGRAQHEQVQIVRLLNDLRGHDWLRVMGVSGVTETKKRAFEPARDHFIRGCEGTLEKFRRWGREEKKRRAEKLGKRQAFLSGGEESVGKEGAETEESDEEKLVEVRRYGQQPGAESGEEAEEADESDVDASIAKQLREEALAAAAKKRRAKAGGKAAVTKRASASRGKATATTASRGKTTTATDTRGKATATTAPSSPHPPADKDPRENVSLFRKRYQRDAALSTNRRKGRKVLAWGELLPEMESTEFQLPGEVHDDASFRPPPRKRGRDRRVKG